MWSLRTGPAALWIRMRKALSQWTWFAPALGWALIVASFGTAIAALALAVALIFTVLAAVHHAELIAHQVGEPFGTRRRSRATRFSQR